MMQIQKIGGIFKEKFGAALTHLGVAFICGKARHFLQRATSISR
jgi:hypothetical protein